MLLNEYDVIIIGAGASGLMAALEMGLAGKKTAVLEAKTEIGGRACTIQPKGFAKPIEAGAEFVHGNLDLTLQLLKTAGIKHYEVRGDIWQKSEGTWQEQKDFIEDFRKLNKKLKSLELDISVQQFIDQHLVGNEFEDARFTLKNYVEGYYAANTERASTFALREELNKSDEEQYRIEGGYGQLLNYLYNECIEKGVSFYFSQPVKEVIWQKEKVTVKTGNKEFVSQKLLVTVPVGVLQSESIFFSPSLVRQTEAAKQLGYGGVIKTILQFREAFWQKKDLTQDKDLSKLSFLFSEAAIPTWWTEYPKNVCILTGWSGGPHAEELKDLTDLEIRDKALQSLSEIFDVDSGFVAGQLVAWHVANWTNDPYSCGGYSYEVVNGSEAKEFLKRAVENTIYFTGEGLFEGPEIGTVNAALFMGRETSRQMIASFKS